MELLYLRLGEDFGKEERKVRQLTRAGEGGEECAAADKSRKLGVYCLLTLEEGILGRNVGVAGEWRCIQK